MTYCILQKGLSAMTTVHAGATLLALVLLMSQGQLEASSNLNKTVVAGTAVATGKSTVNASTTVALTTTSSALIHAGHPHQSHRHRQHYVEILLKEKFQSGNYDKRVRPPPQAEVSASEEDSIKLATVVEIQLRLLQIVEFRWKDQRLSWNPEEYGNLTHLAVHCSDIWTPDIVLMNGLDKAESEMCTTNEHAIVYSNGTVTSQSRYTVTGSCAIKLNSESGYPSSDQSCSICYASWSLPSNELQLALLDEGLDESAKTIDHLCWSLGNVTHNAKEITQTCCSEQFSAVEYQLPLRWVSSQSVCMSVV